MVGEIYSKYANFARFALLTSRWLDRSRDQNRSQTHANLNTLRKKPPKRARGVKTLRTHRRMQIWTRIPTRNVSGGIALFKLCEKMALSSKTGGTFTSDSKDKACMNARLGYNAICICSRWWAHDQLKTINMLICSRYSWNVKRCNIWTWFINGRNNIWGELISTTNLCGTHWKESPLVIIQGTQNNLKVVIYNKIWLKCKLKIKGWKAGSAEIN